MKVDGIMDVLSSGGCIWYEVLTSTPKLVDSNGVLSDVLITYEEFDELRGQLKIEVTAQIAQGDDAFRASIFRGECDRYNLVTPSVKRQFDIVFRSSDWDAVLEPLDKEAEQREEKPAKAYDRNETLRKLVE